MTGKICKIFGNFRENFEEIPGKKKKAKNVEQIFKNGRNFYPVISAKFRISSGEITRKFCQNFKWTLGESLGELN